MEAGRRPMCRLLLSPSSQKLTSRCSSCGPLTAASAVLDRHHGAMSIKERAPVGMQGAAPQARTRSETFTCSTSRSVAGQPVVESESPELGDSHATLPLPDIAQRLVPDDRVPHIV